MSTVEQQTLAAIAQWRTTGAALDGAVLRQRIQALGDIQLNTAERHDAFREIYDALTPAGFDFLPVPNDSFVRAAGSQLRVVAVIADHSRHRQVVAEIMRHFHLDQGFVDHLLFRVQEAYRGGTLSLDLLSQSFGFYRQVGLREVLVKAALETGRWHWARLGFEPTPKDRVLLELWGALCFRAAGEKIMPPSGAPISRWALTGVGHPSPRISLRDLRDGVESELRALQITAGWPRLQPLVDRVEDRSRDREQRSLLDTARWQNVAVANRLRYDDPIPLGKATMLSGPAWNGTFDLTDPAADAVFRAEHARKKAGAA